MGVTWYGIPQRGWAGLGFATSSLCGVRGKCVKASCEIANRHRVLPPLFLVPSLPLSSSRSFSLSPLCSLSLPWSISSKSLSVLHLVLSRLSFPSVPVLLVEVVRNWQCVGVVVGLVLPVL